MAVVRWSCGEKVVCTPAQSGMLPQVWPVVRLSVVVPGQGFQNEGLGMKCLLEMQRPGRPGPSNAGWGPVPALLCPCSTFPASCPSTAGRGGAGSLGQLPVRRAMLGPGGAGGGTSLHPGLLVFSPRPAEKSPCVPRSGAGYAAALAGRDGDRWVGMATAGSRPRPPKASQGPEPGQQGRRGSSPPAQSCLEKRGGSCFYVDASDQGLARLGGSTQAHRAWREGGSLHPAGWVISAGCFPPPAQDGGGTWRGPWAAAGVWAPPPPRCRPPPGSPRPARLTLELGWGWWGSAFLVIIKGNCDFLAHG